MAAINDEIKKIKDEIEVIRVKIDEAQEARRGQGVSTEGVTTFLELGFCRNEGVKTMMGGSTCLCGLN